MEIESEEDLIVSNGQIVAIEQVTLTTVEEQITSSSLEEVLSEEENLNFSWKGKSISTMQHLTGSNCADLPNIIHARNHAVLFHVSLFSDYFYSSMFFYNIILCYKGSYTSRQSYAISFKIQ